MSSVYEQPRVLQAWYERVKGDRINAENTWQEIADNELGQRNFTADREPHQIRTEGIYDTTALFGNQLLDGALHGMMTNPMGEWFEIHPTDLRLLENFQAAVWLDDATRKMRLLMQSQASNFTTQVAEQYIDLTGFGTSAISVMPKRGGRGVSYASHPLAEIYLEVDEERSVDMRFREFELTARQYAARFQGDGHDGVKRALDGNNPEAKFKVRHLIGPSADPYAGPSPVPKPVTSVYWTTDDSAGARILETKGFDEPPLLTPRWNVQPGDTYGGSGTPGWTALPEAKMLNSMSRTILVAAQKATDPPLLVTHEAVLSGIRTYPGGTNIVQQLFGQGGAAEPIRPLQNNANHQLSLEMLKQRQQAVRYAFFSHILQLFEDPRMTATQVLELAQQTQRLMAPNLGRIATELLEPLLKRTFNLLLRQGFFLPMPTELRGQDFNIVYISPVAKAQRQTEVRSVLETYQGVGAIAELTQDPKIFQLLDHDEAVRVIHGGAGAPQRILRDARAVAESRAEEEMKAQMTEQLGALGQGADIVQKLGSAMTQTAGPVAEAA